MPFILPSCVPAEYFSVLNCNWWQIQGWKNPEILAVMDHKIVPITPRCLFYYCRPRWPRGGAEGGQPAGPAPNWCEEAIGGGPTSDGGWGEGPQKVGQPCPQSGEWRIGATVHVPVILVIPTFWSLSFYIYRYHSSILHVLIWLISYLSACYYYSHSPVWGMPGAATPLTKLCQLVTGWCKA